MQSVTNWKRRPVNLWKKVKDPGNLPLTKKKKEIIRPAEEYTFSPSNQKLPEDWLPVSTGTGT